MSLLDGIVHDPGGRRRFPLQPGVVGSATFSACGRYRHSLSRRWGESARTVLWIGMNPITAEHDVDDPTIRREIAFSRRWSYDAYVKVNVMDYRATHPEDLLRPGVVPCSDENFSTITSHAIRSDLIVAAWGALPKALRKYADAVAMTWIRPGLRCLGKTADGSPRHPLYVRGDATLEDWP